MVSLTFGQFRISSIWITAPPTTVSVKPLVRDTVKKTMGIALHMQKLAAEAAEDLRNRVAKAGVSLVRAESTGSPRPRYDRDAARRPWRYVQESIRR